MQYLCSRLCHRLDIYQLQLNCELQYSQIDDACCEEMGAIRSCGNDDVCVRLPLKHSWKLFDYTTACPHPRQSLLRCITPRLRPSRGLKERGGSALLNSMCTECNSLVPCRGSLTARSCGPECPRFHEHASCGLGALNSGALLTPAFR